MQSSQQEPETSGTESTPTNEPEAIDTSLSDELESLESEVGTPPEGRRFVLIVTGTVPGKDLGAERDLVLKTMERAMMGLAVTDGIILNAAAYRSDPTRETTILAPVLIATAPDAPATEERSEADGVSPDAESSDGSSDGSPSSSEDSESPGSNTSP